MERTGRRGERTTTTAASALRCKECERVGELTAAYVCEYCFGPLEVVYDTERIAATVSRERIAAGPALAVALPRLPALRPRRPDGRAADRDDPPACERPGLAAELGLQDVWVKNDTANPTHSFKDRVVSVALEKARQLGYRVVACASTGNLANAVAAHASAHGLESYVFVPADLEEQKIVATAVYGTTLVAVDGVYDDVNRLCMELASRPPLGLRERERAPVLQRGLEDPRLRGRGAARLAPAGPLHRPDRLGLALHEDRPRLPRPDRDRPRRGRRRR